jgi:hypothetical protein
MSDQHFPTMMKFLLASVVLLGAIAVAGLPAYFSVLGIGPLVFYHWRVLVPAAKKGLSTSAIDSVYYFGFLVTVMALAISAIHIAASGAETDTTAVVLQFGVGLFATGYAVFARMHLHSRTAVAGVYTQEEIMDRYMERSAQLIDHIETSTSKLSTFATEAVARTAAAAETIQRTAEANMLRTSDKFAADVAGILASVRAALEGIQVLVTDPDSQAARQRFSADLRETYQASSQLNTAMRELAKRTAEESQQRAETMAATKNLAVYLQDFSSKVRQLSAPEGALVNSSQALQGVSAGLLSTSETVMQALANLHEVGSLVQDTGPTFAKMRTTTKKAAEQLEVLVEATEHLRKAGENVQFASSASSGLNDELARMREMLPALSASGVQLTSSMDAAGKRTQAFEDKLSALPNGLDAVQALQQGMLVGLNQITEDLKAASQQSGRVREHSEATAATVDGANALLAGAVRLDSTVSSIQQRMADLLEAIGSVNTAMQATSQELQAFGANYRDGRIANPGAAPVPAPAASAGVQLDKPEEMTP